MEKLKASHVAIFGIGGVGGYVAEALARSGVGAFTLVDNDTVCLSNLNRQIIATEDTIGSYKAEVMKERILSIHPEARVEVRKCFFLPENADSFDFRCYSYVVDAIDTVTAKLELVLRAREAGVPVISSMGTGNKLDPARLRIADIYETSVCPLARVMRRELRRRGIDKLKVLYSEEEPKKPKYRDALEAGKAPETEALETEAPETGKVPEAKTLETEAPETGKVLEAGKAPETDRAETGRRAVPGSTAFVPPAAGLMIAAEVVRELTGIL